ncbi:MAG: hypothetical protein AB3N23_21635 [Paracoccaceae bacterium]
MNTTSTPKVLALIPARGGSKGLPRKNVLDLLGRPLIAWTVEAALNARCVTRTVVSTDDDEIAAAAVAAGADVPFARPDALASDTATSLDVVLHALDTLEAEGETFDFVALLQPTSPLRTAAHLDAAWDRLSTQQAPSCVSVCEVETSPYLMMSLQDDGRIKPVIDPEGRSLRRQDLPAVYELNGAIYITATAELRHTGKFVTEQTVGFVMPRSVSIDIDNRADFDAALAVMKEALNEDA